MNKNIVSAVRQGGLAFALFVACTQENSIHAQPIFIAPSSRITTNTVPALSEQLNEARVQLKKAQAQRDSLVHVPPNAIRQERTFDKERLLDWIVNLQKEKTKLLEELLALGNLEASVGAEDPQVKALQGTPPYSVLQVDALRDEIDGLKERLASAEASFRANQTEMRNLHDQLKEKEVVLRQIGERTLSARSETDIAKTKDELEATALLKRADEVEIAVINLEQERLNLHIAAWRKRIVELLPIVSKVQPEQRLTLDDLAGQQRRIFTEQEKLEAEILLANKRNAHHRNESDGVVRPSVGLDFVLKTDNAVLKALDHLQMLNSLSGDAWRRRYALLSGPPDQRSSALVALTELQRKLTDLRNQYSTRQEALQTEIHTQRIRIENMAGDPLEQGREKKILNLLLRQTEMDERVKLASMRLEKQVTRWLTDINTPEDKGFRGRFVWFYDQTVSILKSIWEQEVFVAEDLTEIEGRQISVKYGITVGKSIGLIIIFAFGYWLLAGISRLIQHQLVSRFRISHQFALVIHRWVMIGLSLALIILLLNLARIPLSVFAFLGGALAIGVGFGTQTIIKNFIGGLIILFERKVRVGDVIELGGVTGYVMAVDLRATTVRGSNGIEALIPNANFIENQVISWTYSNRQIRRELPVDIAYGTAVSQIEELFLSAIKEHPHVLSNPRPEVYFDGFGDSALKMVLVYWVEFDGPKDPRRIDSDLRLDIYHRLNAAGIVIPFPQQELRVDFPNPVNIRTIQKAE